MKMILCVILAVLSAFPFHRCVSSARIIAADGCIYDRFGEKPSMFTYRVRGSGLFRKECPQSHVFNKRACDCIRDPDMTKSTPSELITKTSSPDFGTTTAKPSSPKSCNFKENPEDKFAFMEKTNLGWQSRACSKGAIFDLATCKCIHWDLVAPSCTPAVEITAENGSVAGVGGSSRYQVHLETNNVNVDSVGLNFDGNSEIRIDAFNNVEYQKGLTISFEFMEAGPILPNTTQVLLTNCDSKTNKSSLEIALIPGRVAFIIDVGMTKYFRRDVQFQPGVFKKVTAMYDGKQFTAIVDNKTGIMNKEGEIQTLQHPLLIGNSECEGKLGFKGKIRGFRLYKCVKMVDNN